MVISIKLKYEFCYFTHAVLLTSDANAHLISMLLMFYQVYFRVYVSIVKLKH